MTILSDLEDALAKLQADRAAARLKVSQYADGSRVEFIEDGDFQAKITALEKRIAAAQGKSIGPVYAHIYSRSA